MGLATLITSFPWARYSRKLMGKIERPRCVGLFTEEESAAREMRLAQGIAGSMADGNLVHLFFLVDKEDGVIVDAKFQAFGQSALLGAAEVACEVIVGKNYDQARRINATILDKHVRDRGDIPSFPPETIPHINLVLEAMETAANQCNDLPLAANYVSPPVPIELGEVLEGGFPGWIDLPLVKKLAVIEEVLDRDVRPYIALDAGGVEVKNLVNDRELIIAYQGTCTSCYSSVGTTLSYIQQIIKAKVHPSLVVVPDLESHHFH